MAPQPTRESARTALTTAGIGAAALVLAAAAAAPAFADGHGDNGNHYGQAKTHTNNGHGDDGQGSTKGRSGDRSSSPQESSTTGSDANGHNPPGNNGTVFIHDVANDHSPHNVPHVGCTFYVDFFGFDANQNVTVSFAGQAPTGKGTQLGGGEDITPVSTDDAGGAGQDWDYEISRTADDLGVSNLGPAAHQGYHVKMTVVTNQPGDHKYKVFWIPACTSAGTTPTEAGDTTTGQSTGSQTSTAGGGSGGSGGSGGATLAAQAAKAPASSSAIPTQVLGRSITRNAATPGAAPAASSLPFTGAEIGGMAAAAAVMLGSGTALMVAARRKRQRA